jgi:hypothetical protein
LREKMTSSSAGRARSFHGQVFADAKANLRNADNALASTAIDGGSRLAVESSVIELPRSGSRASPAQAAGSPQGSRSP